MSALPNNLPALPPPRPRQLRQRLRSVVVVVGSIVLGQALMRGMFAMDDDDPNSTFFMFLTWFHTVVALIGLILIQLLDPGIIRRTDETCQPVPSPVAECLEADQPLDGLKNFVDAQSAKSYCVRCCVWRPIGSHHCSICQRCVCEFDHHCAVFGRCIGGSVDGCRGNLLVFRVNMTNLAAAPITLGIALVAHLTQYLGGVAGALMVFCPASAICIGCIRRNWDDIVALYCGGGQHLRHATAALVSGRERAMRPVKLTTVDGGEDGEMDGGEIEMDGGEMGGGGGERAVAVGAGELHEAVRVALAEQNALEEADDEEAEGCMLRHAPPPHNAIAPSAFPTSTAV